MSVHMPTSRFRSAMARPAWRCRALTNLAGYTVHYGTSPDQLTQVVKLANPGLTSYVVGNLGTGTWYFSVTSYAANGTESSSSGVVSTTIR